MAPAFTVSEITAFSLVTPIARMFIAMMMPKFNAAIVSIVW